MTSAEQVSRLLALVPYLQRHPDADVDTTAATFGVSGKQLLADLNVLWYCGLPGGMPGDLIEIDFEAIDAAGRIRLSNADYLTRPMRFTPDEALSLVVALRAVGELVGDDEGEAVASALAKLEAATGAPSLPKVAVAGGETEVREVLTAAIGADEMVEFDYTDAGLQPSHPVVSPARLLVRDGIGYLQAWSQERADWRTYRLDRIVAIRRTGQPRSHLGEPPAFDPGWFERSESALPVTLVLEPGWKWMAEYIPVQAVTERGGAVELELLVADPAWLRALILRLGTGVREIRPAHAADSARAAAAEALAAYRAG
jgi:proteasome accessory factor C